MKIFEYIKKQVTKIEAVFLSWCPQKLRTPLAVVIFCIPGGCFTLGIIWWFLNLSDHESPFFWNWHKEDKDD